MTDSLTVKARLKRLEGLLSGLQAEVDGVKAEMSALKAELSAMESQSPPRRPLNYDKDE